jgi:acyl-CoA thioesterase FadM
VPAVASTRYALDTGMFSVHQMHPEAALRLGGSVALGGLAERGRSLQSLVTEHGTGLVIMSAEVDYRQELTFFTAPFIRTEATVTLREDGRLLLFRMRHLTGDDGDREAIALRVTARPIALTGGPALDAAAAELAAPVRALFGPEEITPRAALPTRRLQAAIDGWVAAAEPLGGGSRPFFLGRGDCELADQWLYARLPSLVGAAREQLLLDGAAGLAATARQPLAAFHGEFHRPLYFGDRGTVDMAAYRAGERTVVVHEVRGAPRPGAAGGSRPLCALALEVF